jgi:hypothetical protein
MASFVTSTQSPRRIFGVKALGTNPKKSGKNGIGRELTFQYLSEPRHSHPTTGFTAMATEF